MPLVGAGPAEGRTFAHNLDNLCQMQTAMAGPRCRNRPFTTAVYMYDKRKSLQMWEQQ
jgi:hypothetical protein